MTSPQIMTVTFPLIVMEADSFQQPIIKKPATVFSNMPILCPWITSQPYQSTVKIKNKLHELETKKNSKHPSQPAAVQSNHLQQANDESPSLPTPNNYGFPIQESSSHFFYFLRLMQLFPETHPATIHTVLTLTKNNFFHAIDKLLYAKKCRSSFGKKGFRTRTNFNKNSANIQKKSQENVRNSNYQQPNVAENQSFQMEEQETIVLDGSPFELEPISKEKPSDLSTQVFEIRVNGKGQSKQFDLSKLNHEDVIEIVCFENEYNHGNQEFQKNFVYENIRIEENGQQVLEEEQQGSNDQDHKIAEIFLQDLTTDHQNLGEKMDLEPDIDPDLIKINIRPQLSEYSSTLERCQFQQVID